MRAVAYIRASTDKQEASLAQQLDSIRGYADSEGYILAHVFADNASGVAVEGREGFKTLMSVAAGVIPKHLPEWVGDFEVVIVYDRSRWGRWLDHKDAIYWERSLAHLGKRLVSVHGNNGDDIGGDITRMIESHGASEHSRKLSEVVRRGGRHNAERGNWNGGPAPYGYARMEFDPATGKDVRKLEKGQHKGSKAHRVRLVPGDPLEVVNVRSIFGLRAQGYTLEAIAKMLGANASHECRTWSKQLVGNILRNKVYTGDITWADSGGKYESSGETSGKKGAHEALIGGQHGANEI